MISIYISLIFKSRKSDHCPETFINPLVTPFIIKHKTGNLNMLRRGGDVSNYSLEHKVPGAITIQLGSYKYGPDNTVSSLLRGDLKWHTKIKHFVSLFQFYIFQNINTYESGGRAWVPKWEPGLIKGTWGQKGTQVQYLKFKSTFKENCNKR